MSLNTHHKGATLLAALKMKITARGINHSLLHCVDDSVSIPSTTQQRKGKHKWENTYTQQCLGMYIPDFWGPSWVTWIPAKPLLPLLPSAWLWAFGCSQLTGKSLRELATSSHIHWQTGVCTNPKESRNPRLCKILGISTVCSIRIANQSL